MHLPVVSQPFVIFSKHRILFFIYFYLYKFLMCKDRFSNLSPAPDPIFLFLYIYLSFFNVQGPFLKLEPCTGSYFYFIFIPPGKPRQPNPTVLSLMLMLLVY